MFRCLHPAFPVDVGLGGDATHAAGAGTGPEAQSGSCGRLEKSEKTEKHASIDLVTYSPKMEAYYLLLKILFLALQGSPEPGRSGLRQQRGGGHSWQLLQRHHRLVPVLPRVLPPDLPPLGLLPPLLPQHHRGRVRPLQRDPVLLVQEDVGQFRQHWQV